MDHGTRRGSRVTEGDTMTTRTHLKNYLVLALALSAAACTTFGRKGGTPDQAPEGAVVHQPTLKDPVLSQHDRQYWVDLRQSKALMPKLHGALATGEAEASVQLARSYLAKKPGDAQGLTMMAAALAMSRNYDLAAYYATLAERAQPGNAAALNIRGLAMMLGPNRRVADYQQAQELFRQSFDADGTQVAAGLNLGALALEIGNAQVATQAYEEVVERCNRCVAALMGYGVAMSRTLKWDQANAAFDEVLKKKPNHPGALYNLALVQKNGYNNGKQAEQFLFALLNDSGTKDVGLRERAHTVLRMIKGEATREERTMIADGEEGDAAPSDKQPSLGDERDAELLMSGAEMEE